MRLRWMLAWIMLYSVCQGAPKPFQLEWGTKDTALMPRQTIRVWVKLSSTSSQQEQSLDPDDAQPSFDLSFNGETLPLQESTSYAIDNGFGPIRLKPRHSLFSYTTLSLWEVTGDRVARPRMAWIRLRVKNPKLIKPVPESLSVRIVPVDNPDIEKWFKKYDSLRAIPRPYPYNAAPGQDPICQVLAPEYERIERRGRLTGRIAGSMTYLRIKVCQEDFYSRRFVLTPGWPEFAAVQLCRDSARRAQKTLMYVCAKEVEQRNATTRRILKAKKVIHRDQEILLISSHDTAHASGVEYILPEENQRKKPANK